MKGLDGSKVSKKALIRGATKQLRPNARKNKRNIFLYCFMPFHEFILKMIVL